jgi:UrcA family protein
MTGTMIRPLVAAALLAFAAPAFADQAVASAKLAISTSGIDLSTPAGRKALERRVDNAISRLCGYAVLGTREEAEELEACRLEARAEVEPQLQALLLRTSASLPSQNP